MAGLDALSSGGPDAVAIEPLAARLGATKGSGYWHWSSRGALLKAVLGEWQRVATRQVIEAVEAGGGRPRERLERLLALVMSETEKRPGEMLTMTHHAPEVRAVVELATHARIEYVKVLLVETGMGPIESHRRAVIAYAAYLGYAQLAATVPTALPALAGDRAGLQQTLVDLLLD